MKNGIVSNRAKGTFMDLPYERITNLIKKIRDVGFEVTDTMGTHGLCHVRYKPLHQDPVILAYITESGIGFVNNKDMKKYQLV